MSGLPGIATIDTYGGIKQNADPLENRQTDMDAAEWNVMANDCAGMTQTALRSIVRIQLNSTSNPTILGHWSTWGNSPSVIPTVTFTSTGRILFSYPATVTDGNNATQTVIFRDGLVQMRGVQAIRLAPIISFSGSANSFDVFFYTIDASGGVLSNGTAGQQVTVYLT